MVETLFGLRSRGTTVRTEVIAGLTTFLTMAYIVVVNPVILGEAGMPAVRVGAATGGWAHQGDPFSRQS